MARTSVPNAFLYRNGGTFANGIWVVGPLEAEFEVHAWACSNVLSFLVILVPEQ